jgi:membrane-associated phospholipid phosphatase
VSFVLLAGVIIGLGLLLTHVLSPAGGGRLDSTVSRWFVSHRTPTWDTVTAIGSGLGSTEAIVGVAVLAGIVLAIGRHWRQIGFLACALTLEFAVFLLSTVLVDRMRPGVPRLDATPATSSYPSGHTAAAIVLYGGLAIVIWSLVPSRWIRTIAWIIAVALPIFVGGLRLYRGMHHLTDVLAERAHRMRRTAVRIARDEERRRRVRGPRPDVGRGAAQAASRPCRDLRRRDRACSEGARRRSGSAAGRAGRARRRRPPWREVPKSRFAPKEVRRLLDDGVDLLFVWGGDGMVQRCVDAIGRAPVTLAILPAGTANLFASNLGIPHDLAKAVQSGFSGRRRALDVGVVNGEAFAVMAGTGVDALMIRDADGSLKDRLGRFGYVITGVRAAGQDASAWRWTAGAGSGPRLRAGGQHGRRHRRIAAFPSSPDDGRRTSGRPPTLVDWARGRRPPHGILARQDHDREEIVVELDGFPYEVDGGDRPKRSDSGSVDRPRISVCVPERADDEPANWSRDLATDR